MTVQRNKSNESFSFLEGKYILAIDHNEIGQYILQKCLQKWHATFEIVNDVQEAVCQLALHHFDLVLINVEKFDTSYFDTITKLKSTSNSITPIIGLTTLLDEQLEKDVLSSGISAIIQKPIEPKLLLETMVFHLNK